MRHFPLPTLMAATTALAVGLGATPSTAQTMDYDSLETMFGEPVTTSATGSPQKISEAPVPMEIITAEDIKRSGLSNIADIVSRVAGVNVSQNGAQDYTVAVRGYNEPLTGRLLVLINGRQVYLDFFGFTDWSALPVRLEEIRQIEVVKGPNTALFGFNAMAGVINIVTYNPAYDSAGAATARVGNNGTYEASAATSYKLAEGSGVKISGGYNRTDEFSPSKGISFVGANTKPFQATPSLYTLAGEGVLALAPSTQVIAEATTSFHEFSLLSSPQYFEATAQNRISSFRGEVVSNTPLGLITAQAYDNRANAAYEGMFGIDTNLTVAQLQDLLKLDSDTTLRLSGEWRSNEMKSTPDKTGAVSYDVWSVSSMIEEKLTAAATATGALRYDSLQLNRSGGFDPGVPQTNALWDRSLTEVSYNLGVTLQAAEDHNLRVSTARGLQLPSLFNLALQLVAARAPAPLYTGALVLGNPDLNATVATNYELGWDWAISETAKLRSNAYYQINQNLTAISNFNVLPPDLVISRAPYPGLLVAQAEPFGKSDLKGVEISYTDQLPTTGIRYGLNGTILSIRDHLNTQYLRRIDYQKTTPSFEMNGNLGWTNGAWTIDGYLKYVSHSDSFESGTQSNVGGFTRVVLSSIPAYANLDLRIAYQFRPGLSLAFEGHNLVDPEAVRSTGYKIPTQILGALRYEY